MRRAFALFRPVPSVPFTAFMTLITMVTNTRACAALLPPPSPPSLSPLAGPYVARKISALPAELFRRRFRSPA